MALCSPAQAQTSVPPTLEPLILTDEQGKYPLGLHMEILEDLSGELTIEDVTSPEFEAQFIPSQVAVPNYGFTDSAYWVRFTLDNQTLQIHEWLLEQGFANTQFIDLYTPLPDGDGFTVKQTGTLRPAATRDVPHNRFIFNLTILPQSQQTYYLRFQNGASMTLPLTLWTQAAFLDFSLVEQTLMGIFYGVLIGLLFYNLFLLFSLRELSYLYFVILLASLIVEEAVYDGYWGFYVVPYLNFLNKYCQPLSFALLNASILLFSDSFLELKGRLPKHHRVNRVILAAWGALVLLVPFTSYHFIARLMAPWSLLSLITVIVAGGASWKGGYRPARFFMFAWLGMLGSLILVVLVRLGFIPSTFLSEYSYRLGFLWMGVCWSIALADRINLLKAEKEKANSEIQASEARYKQLVETMNDGLGVIDENGSFTYINNRFAEMLGYPPEEIIGHPVVEFTNEANLQILAEQLEKRSTGSRDPYELTWRRKDGEEIFTQISPVPLFEDGGRYKGAFAVITDITERVRAGRLLEQRVDERTHELYTLLELSHEITSTEGLDFQLNQILERLKMVVDYSYAAILLSEEESWAIKVCFPATILEQGQDLHISSGEAHALTQIFESRKPLLLNNSNGLNALSTWLGQIFPEESTLWLGIPIVSKDRLVGFFILSRDDENGFSDGQVKIAAAFANQAAIVIENKQLNDLARANVAAVERNRLAQELHDSVTQTLFSASILAQATPRIWERDQGLARLNMEKLNTLIRGALAEMRSLLLELRSGALQNQTLGQLLNTLVEAGQVRTHTALSISISGDRKLPEKVTLTLYRIAQGALNNAINHADATQISIDLIEDAGWVELRIQDDGRGFNPEVIPAGHLGISIMSERAAQIGASLQIQSQPGRGTNLIVTWPKEGESAEYE